MKTESLLANGMPRWIEHPSLGEKADFVALPLTGLQDVELYPYDLFGGPSIAMNPAEPICVAAFPSGPQVGGSLAVRATGFVASERRIDFNNWPVFLIDCRTRPRRSGSAVSMHRGWSRDKRWQHRDFRRCRDDIAGDLQRAHQ